MPWESWVKPEKCPGPCLVCNSSEESPHHYEIECPPPGDDGEPDLKDEDYEGHPAIVAGHIEWWQCRHCDKWLPFSAREDMDDDLIDD